MFMKFTGDIGINTRKIVYILGLTLILDWVYRRVEVWLTDQELCLVSVGVIL